MIGKSEGSYVHPTEKRTLTQREKAHLMGMPFDFVIDDVPGGTIGQNVPVNTAADMVSQAVKFIKGELKLSNSDYVIQNNIKQRIDFVDKTYEVTKLF